MNKTTINTTNQKALNQIHRTIQLSEGQFTLILAHCNYEGLRNELLREIRKKTKNIKEVILPPLVPGLFSFINDQIEEPPEVVMVFGLERVKDLDKILLSANQVREEFRNHFNFPVIIWVDNAILVQFNRNAPDFKSWAGLPVSFEADDDRLFDDLQEYAEKLFEQIQKNDVNFLNYKEVEIFLQAFINDTSKRKLELKDERLKADLQFLRALNYQNQNKIQAAVDHFKDSLFLRKGTGDRIKQGLLQNCIGRCREQNNELKKARRNFQICIDAFKENHELQVKYINDYCRVLRKLKSWDDLILAAENAPNVTAAYAALANAHAKKGDRKQKIKILKPALKHGDYESDPGLYVEIMEFLNLLYFKEKKYREAFEIKQDKLSLEQQFGLRAFIGAGRLKAHRRSSQKDINLTEEIQASGRQLDVERLISMFSSSECRLIVIHGQSGVGKSSILEAGVIPSLKQTTITSREIIPILLRNYQGWAVQLGKSFQKAMSKADRSVQSTLDSKEVIVKNLNENQNQNILTALIFDQFEEFFFANPHQKKRFEFYEFLHNCLSTPFTKVILSLREDYLHYLLECDRYANLEMINNDILNKKIRYSLGNFKKQDAVSVIKSLTARTQFRLEESLIDKVVEDLAKDTNDVRPIELQIVGSQLQEEKIITLEKYKPKEELVEAFLEKVVQDCGKENQEAVHVILYNLTDENNTRPLRTKTEFENALKDLDIKIDDENFDLILKILVGSGLLFVVPEKPVDRYQLVHDYLAEFIRKGNVSDSVVEFKELKLQRYAEEKEREKQEEKERLRQKRQFRIVVFAGILFAVWMDKD